MLIFLICLAVYLFESLRSEIVIMTINHKLSKVSDKKVSRWWCLGWVFLYVWLAYRKQPWMKRLIQFLMFRNLYRGV